MFNNKFTKSIHAIKSLFSKLPYSICLYRSKDIEDEITNIINHNNIDIIHVDTIGLIDNILDRINSKTVKVLNHHNIESDMMLRRAQKEESYFKKSFLVLEARNLQKYEYSFCPKYDLNIVVSDLDNKRLLDINKNIRTATIENGVDCKYFEHYYRGTNNRGLIFAGSLDWYPNDDAMFYFCREVWPILKNRYRDLSLTIIGKNPSGRLCSVVAKEQNIFLKGYVPDVRPYIKQAKIFICPIRDGGGTRLKILDALAQGIPVVSTNVGCEGLNLKDGEHILIANTPAEFFKQITLLLSNDELCNQLSWNGRYYVEEHYSFSAIGNKLSNLYEQLKSEKLKG